MASAPVRRGVNEKRREGSCLQRPPGYQEEEEDLLSGQKGGYKGARTLALGCWRRHGHGTALARRSDGVLRRTSPRHPPRPSAHALSRRLCQGGMLEEGLVVYRRAWWWHSER